MNHLLSVDFYPLDRSLYLLGWWNGRHWGLKIPSVNSGCRFDSCSEQFSIKNDDPMKLLGKKAIVTGANRSIGRAIAIAFAQEGADVVISYRSDEKGAKQTVGDIEQLGRSGKCFFADFSKTEGVRQFFQQALDYLGHIDILVNNAGGYDTSSFLDLSIDKFESVLKISVSAPMLLTQLAAQSMIQECCRQNYQHIFNLRKSSLSQSCRPFYCQSSLKYVNTGHGP